MIYIILSVISLSVIIYSYITADNEEEYTIIDQLAAAFLEQGITAYYVGGYVRDKLMGVKSDDIDICLVGVKDANIVESILTRYSDNFVKEVGNSFPVYIINIDGKKYDIALARTEKKIGYLHSDFICHTENVTIEEDLMRRDLTINSIAENILTGMLIDPFLGIEHINLRVAHHTSEAFAEDPLRVLRVARFISRFEFEPTIELIDICRTLSPFGIPPQRVGKELMKTFQQAVRPSLFFNFLKKINWLQYHFKDLLNCIAIPQSPIYHPEGNVYIHTMHCLDATKQGDWMTRAVMLCHDLGKVSCTIINNDKISSIGHEEASVPLCDSLLKSIHFCDHKTINQIKVLVSLHMIGTIYNPSEKVIRKTLRTLRNSHLTYDQLVEVCRCDKSGRPPLPPFTPNIGQTRAKYLEESEAMIPIVTGKLLIANNYTDQLDYGKLIKRGLDLQDRGVLNINNWKNLINKPY